MKKTVGALLALAVVGSAAPTMSKHQKNYFEQHKQKSAEELKRENAKRPPVVEHKRRYISPGKDSITTPWGDIQTKRRPSIPDHSSRY